MYGSLRQLSNCHCNFGLQSRPRAFTPPRKKGGNNEKKNYQSDCCEENHECCGQHELARPICGNLSGSITARSQPLRAKRSSPVGREDKPSHNSCQHSYTKLNNRGSHNSTRTKAKNDISIAVNNYIHSTKGIMGVVNILGVFCLKTAWGANRGRGEYVWHPSGCGHCVNFLCPAVAVLIVSAFCGAAPVDPF